MSQAVTREAFSDADRRRASYIRSKIEKGHALSSRQREFLNNYEKLKSEKQPTSPRLALAPPAQPESTPSEAAPADGPPPLDPPPEPPPPPPPSEPKTEKDEKGARAAKASFSLAGAATGTLYGLNKANARDGAPVVLPDEFFPIFHDALEREIASRWPGLAGEASDGQVIVTGGLIVLGQRVALVVKKRVDSRKAAAPAPKQEPKRDEPKRDEPRQEEPPPPAYQAPAAPAVEPTGIYA